MKAYGLAASEIIPFDFDKLPFELQIHILSSVEPKHLANCFLASKKVSELAKYVKLVKQYKLNENFPTSWHSQDFLDSFNELKVFGIDFLKELQAKGIQKLYRVPKWTPPEGGNYLNIKDHPEWLTTVNVRGEHVDTPFIVAYQDVGEQRTVYLLDLVKPVISIVPSFPYLRAQMFQYNKTAEGYQKISESAQIEFTRSQLSEFIQFIINSKD